MRQPRALMIFAAGFGTRMGALTADRPKPLVKVSGRALIDRALGIGRGAGCDPIVVNLHYRAGQLADHLRDSGVRLSWETGEILETGGGLRKALPLLGPGPIIVLNPDAVWTGPNPIEQLRSAWDPVTMDALLLLAPLSAVRGHGGREDFLLDSDGRIARHAGSTRPGHVYLGAQILRPEGLHQIPDRVFSLNRLWDDQISRGRAFGRVHSGGWCDVGTPQGVTEAEAMLREAGDV